MAPVKIILCTHFLLEVLTLRETGIISIQGRRIMKNKSTLIVSIIITLIILLAIIFFADLFISSTPAFADVAEPLLNSRTVTFNMSISMEVDGVQTGMNNIFCMYAEPCHMRIMSSDDSVAIVDIQQGKLLTLMPDEKIAIIIEMQNFPAESNEHLQYCTFFDALSLLRHNLDDESRCVESLPEAEIDGRAAVGYCIYENENKVKTNFWFDAETLLPVKIEMILDTDSIKMTDVMTDFSFDEELAPDLFSMEIPEGYITHNMPIDFSTPDEEKLIEMFRVWAEHTDGEFPPDLTLNSIKDFFTGTSVEQKQSQAYMDEYKELESILDQLGAERDKITKQIEEITRLERELYEKTNDSSLSKEQKQQVYTEWHTEHNKNLPKVRELRKRKEALFDEKMKISRQSMEAFDKGMLPVLERSEKTMQQGFEGLFQNTKAISGGFAFVQTLPPESDWHYAGKTAVFGDSNTPIFWYLPKGSSTWCVIYADLSVNNVTPDQLSNLAHEK